MGRRKDREEPQYIEISETPWTSETWIQLLPRQRKVEAVAPPESQPSRPLSHGSLGGSAAAPRAHRSADDRSPQTLRNVSAVIQTKLLPFKITQMSF